MSLFFILLLPLTYVQYFNIPPELQKNPTYLKAIHTSDLTVLFEWYNGFIYVKDKDEQEFKKLAGKGFGPGELMRIMSISLNHDTLSVFDGRQLMIKHYDLNSFTLLFETRLEFSSETTLPAAIAFGTESMLVKFVSKEIPSSDRNHYPEDLYLYSDDSNKFIRKLNGTFYEFESTSQSIGARTIDFAPQDHLAKSYIHQELSWIYDHEKNQLVGYNQKGEIAVNRANPLKSKPFDKATQRKLLDLKSTFDGTNYYKSKDFKISPASFYEYATFGKYHVFRTSFLEDTEWVIYNFETNKSHHISLLDHQKLLGVGDNQLVILQMDDEEKGPYLRFQIIE